VYLCHVLVKNKRESERESVCVCVCPSTEEVTTLAHIAKENQLMAGIPEVRRWQVSESSRRSCKEPTMNCVVNRGQNRRRSRRYVCSGRMTLRQWLNGAVLPFSSSASHFLLSKTWQPVNLAELAGALLFRP